MTICPMVMSHGIQNKIPIPYDTINRSKYVCIPYIASTIVASSKRLASAQLTVHTETAKKKITDCCVYIHFEHSIWFLSFAHSGHNYWVL